jgi:hypothetical protein
MLIGASYITMSQDIQVGPLHFTVIRILVAVGVMRVTLKRERVSGGWKPLDRLMVLFGGAAVLSSCFHDDFSSALISRLALVYDSLGFYFLLRVFIQDSESILTVGKVIIIVLIPLSIEMVLEKVTERNLFAYFGGVSAESVVREGKIRAQGPFGHPILAGTVGAVCWPFAVMFWRSNRKLALMGFAVMGAIVLTSSSSGPIMTTFSILSALALWKARERMRAIRWAFLGLILILNIVMQAPVYYLLARIDLTGSSTGWHRAELIHAAITHFGEWWAGGTDYTRHWMPTGVPWSPNHTDITNHYIKMGVIGGFPLMLLFIGVLTTAFSAVGKALKLYKEAPFESQFRIWILGSILFGHAATFLSIYYFDQSVIFLFLLLACIGALQTKRTEEATIQD